MALCITSESHAREIATRFFEQYNSLVVAKEAAWHGNVWTITVIVGGIKPETRKIMINSEDGRITGYL